MLQNVDVNAKSLEDYRPIVGDEQLAEIHDLAEGLQDARVAHVNATAFGGGVAEVLTTLVPLMRDVGLDAHWYVIVGEEPFFNVTKAFHNGLQGMAGEFTDEMKEIYLRNNEVNAGLMEDQFDFIVIHDPQPLAMRHFCGRMYEEKWIWRSHIDTSTPNLGYLDFIAPYTSLYDAAIFTMDQYVGKALDLPKVMIIHPSIDPLTEKNRPMSHVEGESLFLQQGVDPERPVMCQVSRYDPWKDPLGVIDAYRLVKKRMPDLQLVLMGTMASDDPEGWEYYRRTVEHSAEDPDVHLLQFQRPNDLEVNAFQTFSDVVVQKSTREGFGLVVTEALWKGQAVVGGNVGGIPLQIIDGETGFLVNNYETCAQRVLYLLENSDRAQEMGERAREHVRRHFLTTRHLADYLRLFNELSES